MGKESQQDRKLRSERDRGEKPTKEKSTLNEALQI